MTTGSRPSRWCPFVPSTIPCCMSNRKSSPLQNYFPSQSHDQQSPAGDLSSAQPAAENWNPVSAASSMSSRGSFRPGKSEPIAIKRNDDDDDERRAFYTSEDDDSFVDLDLDALRIAGRASEGQAAQSLPSRLLRAPFLGSLPSNEERLLNNPSMLPPAMSLTDSNLLTGESSFISEQGTPAAYGSLRESHMKGRFIDGPSSFRDRNTGAIRHYAQRVRFQDTNTTRMMSASLPVMSIGERIMNAKKLRNEKEHTSSLASMLETPEGDNDLSNLPTESAPLQEFRPSFYDEDEGASNFTSGDVLSTSLTGFELLRVDARRARTSLHTFETAQSSPRDSQDSNNVLSRTLSDPSPDTRTLQTQSDASLSLPEPLFALPPSHSFQLPEQQISDILPGSRNDHPTASNLTKALSDQSGLTEADVEVFDMDL